MKSEDKWRTAVDRWNEMSETEKLHKCLHNAMCAMQGFLLNHEDDETFSEYCALLRAQIDWITIFRGDPPSPMYYGPGINNARDFHLNIIEKTFSPKSSNEEK